MCEKSEQYVPPRDEKRARHGQLSIAVEWSVPRRVHGMSKPRKTKLSRTLLSERLAVLPDFIASKRNIPGVIVPEARTHAQCLSALCEIISALREANKVKEKETNALRAQLGLPPFDVRYARIGEARQLGTPPPTDALTNLEMAALLSSDDSSSSILNDSELLNELRAIDASFEQSAGINNSNNSNNLSGIGNVGALDLNSLGSLGNLEGLNDLSLLDIASLNSLPVDDASGSGSTNDAGPTPGAVDLLGLSDAALSQLLNDPAFPSGVSAEASASSSGLGWTLADVDAAIASTLNTDGTSDGTENCITSNNNNNNNSSIDDSNNNNNSSTGELDRVLRQQQQQQQQHQQQHQLQDTALPNLLSAPPASTLPQLLQMPASAGITTPPLLDVSFLQQLHATPDQSHLHPQSLSVPPHDTSLPDISHAMLDADWQHRPEHSPRKQ
ncbi:MAG: hypothetical protein MHM6MM_002224 [Cercozoa sp. M6MM]